jgi:ASC-1-like (ASCH) protein
MSTMKHIIFIQESGFKNIVKGTKTVEGRCLTLRFRKISSGDTLEFICGEETILCHCIKAIVYDGFHEMISDIGINSCLPTLDTTDIDDAVDYYHSFKNYKKKADKNGVVAIHIKKLDFD